MFKIIRWLVWFFYPKIKVYGLENVPKENAVIVGNHTQLHGPIICELYAPENCYTWCASEMMEFTKVPGYAFKDFWSQKPKYLHPFFKVLSYIITPLSVFIFNRAKTVPVYKNMKIMSTFKTSVKLLNEGKNLVIFPEHDVKYNNIVYDFQENFVDVAKLYFKKSGKKISFVPLYIAPKLKSMYFGKPVLFNPEADIKTEKVRICNYLKEEITKIAVDLPRHTVVPYRNIPKKLYPTNKDF